MGERRSYQGKKLQKGAGERRRRSKGGLRQVRGRHPGTKGGHELRSKVRLPLEPGELAKTARGKDEGMARRLRIKKSDLDKLG